MHDGPASPDGQAPQAAIVFKDACVKRGGRVIWRHGSFSIPSGSVTAIVGTNGAGKTTMLSLISGLTNPTEGQVLYNGNDLAKQDRYRYRSHDIGVIFQSFNLLPNLTVAENIILSLDASGKTFDKSKKEMVLDLLKQVHLPKNGFCTCRVANNSASPSLGR